MYKHIYATRIHEKGKDSKDEAMAYFNIISQFEGEKLKGGDKLRPDSMSIMGLKPRTIAPRMRTIGATRMASVTDRPSMCSPTNTIFLCIT